MYPHYVDRAIQSLERLLGYIQPQHPHPIDTMILDLRFFKMLLWGWAYQVEFSDQYFYTAWYTMACELCQGTEMFSTKVESTSDTEELIAYWEPMSDHLKSVIQQNKEKARIICLLLLYRVFTREVNYDQGSFFEYAERTVYFIDLIQENLRALESKQDFISQVKGTFSFIERKLKVFGKFAYVAKHKQTPTFTIFSTHVWASHISWLACLYWVDADIIDERLACVGVDILCDLMPRYMPYSTSCMLSYINVLKAKSSCTYQDGKVINELLVSYVDFLIEPLIMPTKEVGDNFREGLIFLLSYIGGPLKYTRRQRIMSEVTGIIREVVSLISGLQEANLPDMLLKIDGFKIKVRELCALTPLPLGFGFPKTDPVGFIDSFSSNLEKMLNGRVDFIPFVKHQVDAFQDQLVLIRSTLQHNAELRHGSAEFKDMWIRIINVVYFASYVIKLCPMASHSIWYGIIFLPIVIDDLTFVNSELEKFRHGTMYSDTRVINDDAECNDAMRVPATTSKVEGTFIGFKQDVMEVQDHLVAGRRPLTIVSVSGMAGRGKTTLAKKIYNAIQLHFHIKVWCYVSKECHAKALLEKIAQYIGGIDIDDILEIQDIIERVWRRLKGYKYLIVLDDIWDVDVWLQVRGSFPDDNNGSRILFTTRNHDLASHAKPLPIPYNNLACQAVQPSISYRLQPFSNEESWELMKDMLFDFADLQGEFLTMGKQISDHCNGLPLAVALIGALLKRVGPVLDEWKEVAQKLNSYLAVGCMHIIELSYKYLPEHLKPCFLYFAAFGRGEEVLATRLKQLWIAEGFVKDNGMQLAEKYLDDLVSQNVVVVTSRNFRGGIKGCRVHHDLLYDLCLKKAEQDEFLHFASIKKFNSYDYPYRVCLKEDGPVTLKQSTNVKELPTSQIHTLLMHDNYRMDCETAAWFFNRFNVLGVLEIFMLSTFPEEIFSLIHLRYLALGGSLRYIPASIADLWNLETLILNSYYPIQAPDTLWGMESLKYVATSPHLITSSFSLAVTCNIEVLEGISLRYDLKTKEFLKRLVKLRKLTCHCLADDKRVVHPLLFSMFASLENLDSLSVFVHWDDSPVYHQFPTFKFHNNLKSLKLERLQLPWRVMSDIGKLPNLEFLRLQHDACDAIFYSYQVKWARHEDYDNIWCLGREDFPKLRYLKLEDLSIVKLDDSCCDHPFPRLEKIFVNNCGLLEEIPLSFGEISTLDTISVSGSRELLNSVRRIVKEQRGGGNEHLKVFGVNEEEEDEDNLHVSKLNEFGSDGGSDGDDNFDSHDDSGKGGCEGDDNLDSHDDDQAELDKRKALEEWVRLGN